MLLKDINNLNSLLLGNFNALRSSYKQSMCLYYYSWLKCYRFQYWCFYVCRILMRKATATIAQRMWLSEKHLWRKQQLLFSFVCKNRIEILSDYCILCIGVVESSNLVCDLNEYFRSLNLGWPAMTSHDQCSEKFTHRILHAEKMGKQM